MKVTEEHTTCSCARSSQIRDKWFQDVVCDAQQLRPGQVWQKKDESAEFAMNRPWPHGWHCWY
eukprot:3934349-Rhodomonas_salina.1